MSHAATVNPATPAVGSVASHDIFRTEKNPLDFIFLPRNVAVIGATETANAVGRTILMNLITSPFGGTVYPVNPKRSSVLGIRAYPTIAAVPEKVDLAVIVTPAASVPALVKECGEAGVGGIIVISAGFKETGPAGVKLEQDVLAYARQYGIRIIGPNCLGLMNPLTGLNASFAKGIAKPGNVAFISQSGALCTAVLDWSLKEQVGFSAFVSIGSMLDVGWGDLIDYLGNDPRTTSILIYMESIGDARRFLSAAREVALNKPIIVIKPGRTEQASKAAASHTGSLTGSDEVLEAAFRRTGVLRVQNIADLFYMAEVLAKQPRPRGNRLTIVTNAGGPGVLATDALITNGGALADVSPQTIDELNKFLPAAWSHNNPIDVLGDAQADRYAKTLEIAAADPNSDGLLVILTPQDMTDATGTAELLKKYAKIDGKPVIASWMGGGEVQAGEAILNRANIPTFPYPDTAARAFTYMYRYTYNLRGLYETPAVGADESTAAHHAEAGAKLKAIRASGRTLLDEAESKALLASYGIPVVPTLVAQTADAAATLADEMGYPVVVKLYSKTITHKTDVGGVKLNLRDAAAVREAFAEIERSVSAKHSRSDMEGVTVQPHVGLHAKYSLKDSYELILGASPDPQFGPVLLFGAGGVLVEVFKDRALALPPLNATLARRMMEQTKIHHALQGIRGRPPVDLPQLEQVLARFSQLIVEHPYIKELDINPFLVSHHGMMALDARVVLYGNDVPDDKLPKPAIRPYPAQYSDCFRLKDNADVLIRPIKPEDEPAMVKFHHQLSERSVRFRYFQPLKLGQRIAHERLSRMCFNDYDRELALVAERDCAAASNGNGHASSEREIVAVGRLSRVSESEAEFAMLVSDTHQNKGLGTQLLNKLLAVAKAEGLSRVTASILPENVEMQRVCTKVGFKLRREIDDAMVKAAIELK
jgi:acetyltransferase